MEILARIMMSKYFSVGRTLIMLYGVVSMTGPGAYAEEAREALSLRRFEDCQEEYCDRLVEKLNEPIEWRLVLDVSGSFGDPPQANLKKVRTVVRQLPLADGDLLCLDFFGLGYREGDCRTVNEERKRSLEGHHSFLTVLIKKAKKVQVEARDLTDIPAVVDALAHRDCIKERCYYVFLTDGMYEPEGFRGKPQPLFTGGSEGFLRQIVEFVQPSPTVDVGVSFQLVRGLHFVIDVSQAGQAGQDDRTGQSKRDALTRQEVAEDWLAGADDLVEREQARREVRRAFYPRIHVTTFEGTDLFITDDLRKEVDRREGVYACLLSAPSGKPEASVGREASAWEWPTVHGGPYPVVVKHSKRCPAWPAATYSVLLPAELLAPANSQAELSIRLLTYGNPAKAPSLVAKFTPKWQTNASVSEEENIDGAETRKEYTLDPPPSAAWRQYPVSIPLTLTRDRIQGQLSPIRASLKLDTASRAPEFLNLEIHGQHATSAAPYVRDVRGVFALTVTLASLVSSYIFLFQAARRKATLNVELQGVQAKANYGKTIPPLSRSLLVNCGLRMEIDEQGKPHPMGRERPSKAPTFAKGREHFFLDIIPLGLLIYIVVWRRRGRDYPAAVDSDALDVTEKKAVAKLVCPKTTWISVSGTGVTGNHWRERWQRFLSTFSGLRLMWGKNLEIAHRKGRAGGVPEGEAVLELAEEIKVKYEYKISLTLDRWSRIFRTVGLLLHILAAAGAYVAIRQFLGPDGSTPWRSTLQDLLCPFLVLLSTRLAFHLLSVVMHCFSPKLKERLLTIIFRFNRGYLAVFGGVLCSSIILAIANAGHAYALIIILLLSIASLVFVNAIPIWVKRRISERKSFSRTDIIFDTFLSYGPIAT